MQQAAERKLFGQGSEKENAERKERKRLQLGPLRFELNEVDRVSEGNGDAGENHKTRRDEEAPVMAPADGIADAADAAEEHETRQRDVNAEKHRKNVGEASAGKRPEPVRQRPSPGIRKRLYGHPYAHENEEVPPRAGRLALGGGGERERNENETGDGSGTRERESICPQAVNQVDKEHRGAQQVAAAGAEARGEAIRHAACGKKQHHQKGKRESRQRGGEGPATIAQPGGVQRPGKSRHGPETEHGERAELARGGAGRIVTQREGRAHSTYGTTAGIHRLDARTGVRADVSDALLRLVDEPGGEEVVVIDWVVEAGRDAAGAVVHFFGGAVVCGGDGKVARKGNRADGNPGANDAPRPRSFC